MNNLLIEASKEGKPFFSKSIDCLKTVDGEDLFPEVFEIPSCEALHEYEDLNDFVIGITGFMMEMIDPFDLLVVTSSDEENVLLWSIEIKLDGTEISLRTIDWKNSSCVYRKE
ncbi:MAG: hypothetical protein MR867_05940 [Eubacterium sp.]|nr:hypothetical protein [Eubacterium sp.]MDD7209766.1 hypothetical protein [Lachnospiraceae bacterium]MDY5496789.1 hypothetical protein [Anaerobutyricum sp.]